MVSSREYVPEFWCRSLRVLMLVNLLVGFAMYALMLAEPWIIGKYFHENLAVAGAVVSVFGIGIYFLGPVANALLDRYKRKSIALWALLFMFFFTIITLYDLPEWMYVAARFMQGTAYGLFQIALGSTLLIDLTHTKNRTRAARWYYWGGRYALAGGPLAALLLRPYYEWENVAWLSASFILLAWLMLASLHVPFRSPLEPRIFSWDRFWLPRAGVLYFALLPLSFSLGLLIPSNYTIAFYLWMLAGIFAAHILQLLCFGKKDSIWPMMMGFASLLGVYVFNFIVPVPAVVPCTGILAGLGGGLLTSRFLIYFMRVAEHCERGTAQNTYLLGWESGLCAGMLCSAWVQQQDAQQVYSIGLIVTLLSALLYFVWVHRWFLQHSRKGM